MAWNAEENLNCECITLTVTVLQTSILNKHLQELMDGLTAKVFRTYNASITLQQQLNQLTNCKSCALQIEQSCWKHIICDSHVLV